MKIKILTPEDWQQYKLVRLEALRVSPESFLASYEEEAGWPDVNFQNICHKSNIFGAFIDHSLVCCAGFDSLDSARTNHRGSIWGMYTKPKCREQGIANAVIRAIVIHARSCVSQIHLMCATSNLGALSLYQKNGFKIYGTEPRSIKINDTYIDKHLMILDLTQPLNKT